MLYHGVLRVFEMCRRAHAKLFVAGALAVNVGIRVLRLVVVVCRLGKEVRVPATCRIHNNNCSS